jgi:hypothetical protein
LLGPRVAVPSRRSVLPCQQQKIVGSMCRRAQQKSSTQLWCDKLWICDVAPKKSPHAFMEPCDSIEKRIKLRIHPKSQLVTTLVIDLPIKM